MQVRVRHAAPRHRQVQGGPDGELLSQRDLQVPVPGTCWGPPGAAVSSGQATRCRPCPRALLRAGQCAGPGHEHRGRPGTAVSPRLLTVRGGGTSGRRRCEIARCAKGGDGPRGPTSVGSEASPRRARGLASDGVTVAIGTCSCVCRPRAALEEPRERSLCSVRTCGDPPGSRGDGRGCARTPSWLLPPCSSHVTRCHVHMWFVCTCVCTCGVYAHVCVCVRLCMEPLRSAWLPTRTRPQAQGRGVLVGAARRLRRRCREGCVLRGGLRRGPCWPRPC